MLRTRKNGEAKRRRVSRHYFQPGVVAYSCNPSPWEAEAGGSLQVRDQTWSARQDAISKGKANTYCEIEITFTCKKKNTTVIRALCPVLYMRVHRRIMSPLKLARLDLRFIKCLYGG